MSVDHPFCNPMEHYLFVDSHRCTYQWCLTKQPTATYKISNCHVEVIVSTAPVRYLSEGIVSQDVLQCHLQSKTKYIFNKPLSWDQSSWHRSCWWQSTRSLGSGALFVAGNTRQCTKRLTWHYLTHLHFKECWSKCWPFENDFQESNLCIILALGCVLVKSCYNGLIN